MFVKCVDLHGLGLDLVAYLSDTANRSGVRFTRGMAMTQKLTPCPGCKRLVRDHVTHWIYEHLYKAQRAEYVRYLPGGDNAGKP